MKKKPSALQNRQKISNPKDNLTERVTFRLSATEKKALEIKASERGIGLSHLCRLVMMRRRIPDRSEETRRWLRDITGISNNLNQIARHMNTMKESDRWALDAIAFIASEVRKTKDFLMTDNHGL